MATEDPAWALWVPADLSVDNPSDLPPAATPQVAAVVQQAVAAKVPWATAIATPSPQLTAAGPAAQQQP